MTHYAIHPLMLATISLSYPVIFVRNYEFGSWMLIGAFLLFLMATLGSSSLYVASQRVLYSDWRSRVRWIPLMTLVGTGIAVSNSRAVLEGLFFSGGNFVRTPKFGTLHPGDLRSKMRHYWLKMDLLPYLELAFGVYALLAFCTAVTTLWTFISPFLLIYACGFFYISFSGIRESLDWIVSNVKWRAGTNAADLEGPDGR